MKIPRLGLVCISARLTKQKIAAKTMTRKSFLSNSREKSIEVLSERILHNSRHVLQTLRAAHAAGARHYRVSSSLFPLVTDSTLELSYADLHNFDTISANLRAAGDYARANDITLSSHPDQFNVLVSYNPDVVRRTILELNHQSAILDMMGAAHDYSSPMCLHLNKTPEERRETLDEYVSRFCANLGQCSEGVRNRLVLENEDKAYWNCDALYENFGDKIPLVYDNLHDVCNSSSDPVENAARFRKTWRGHTPVFHWSEGIGSTRSHADYATHLPHVVSQHSDVTWEVELKAKDDAIAHIIESFFHS
jgi:UV DNA damage endonuclease